MVRILAQEEGMKRASFVSRKRLEQSMDLKTGPGSLPRSLCPLLLSTGQPKLGAASGAPSLEQTWLWSPRDGRDWLPVPPPKLKLRKTIISFCLKRIIFSVPSGTHWSCVSQRRDSNTPGVFSAHPALSQLLSTPQGSY